jgi:hypothetical protein
MGFACAHSICSLMVNLADKVAGFRATTGVVKAHNP